MNYPELKKEDLTTYSGGYSGRFDIDPEYRDELTICIAPKYFSVDGINYNYDPENQHGQYFFNIRNDYERRSLTKFHHKCLHGKDFVLDEDQYLTFNEITCMCGEENDGL